MMVYENGLGKSFTANGYESIVFGYSMMINGF